MRRASDDEREGCWLCLAACNCHRRVVLSRRGGTTYSEDNRRQPKRAECNQPKKKRCSVQKIHPRDNWFAIVFVDLLSAFENAFTVYWRHTVTRRATTSHRLCLVSPFYESRLLNNSTNKLSILKVYPRQMVLLYKRLTNDIQTNTQSPNITNTFFFYLNAYHN